MDDRDGFFCSVGLAGAGGRDLLGLVRGGIARIKDLNDRTGRSIFCRREEYSMFCLSEGGLFKEVIPQLSRTDTSEEYRSPTLVFPECYVTKGCGMTLLHVLRHMRAITATLRT